MYKLALLPLLCLTLSCKKTYECNCSTTIVMKFSSGATDTRIFPNQPEAYSEKLSKKQAEASCSHQEEAIQTSITNAWTNNGLFPLEDGESIVTECTLTN